MKTKRLVSAALILLVNLGFAAALFASGSNQRQNAAAGVETLEIYGMGNTSGVQEGTFYTEIWKEDLGIVFSSIPSNQDVLNSLVASRNLPDILFVQQFSDTDTMIKAGLLLDWDEQKSKLPNVYAPNLVNAVQYRRDMLSNGTGGLYGLGVDITSNGQTVGTLNFGPYLRWDYYKEIGSPGLTEFEDYLTVLKRIQDAHPTNDAGQRVYGLSLFSDWDAGAAIVGPLGYVANLYGTNYFGHLEVDYIKNTTRSVLDNDSFYKRSLQFYFNANQAGILDPDSITQGYSDYLAKGKAGRVLFSYWPWSVPGEFRTTEREAAGVGYRLVPFANEKVLASEAAAQPIGDTRSWIVSKNTKHVDKAMAFIDFIYSFDGILLMQNGRQGVKWDVNASGQPYFTKLGWDIANGVADYPTGGSQGKAGDIPPGLNWRSIHPTYGRQLSGKDWIRNEFAPADTTLVADWKRIMNANDDIDYFTKHNMLAIPPFAPMDPTPDNIMVIQNRVGEVIVPLSWQMVYARNQAEFDQLWNQMVEQAKGRGIDTEIEWYRDAWARARTTGAKYSR